MSVMVVMGVVNCRRDYCTQFVLWYCAVPQFTVQLLFV